MLRRNNALTRGPRRGIDGGLVDLVTDWLRRRAAYHPERPALRFRDATWSFGELDGATDRVAAALRAEVWLERAWAPVARVTGHQPVVARYAGRLPERGRFPAGARDADAAFFMGFANDAARAAFNERATVPALPAFLTLALDARGGAHVERLELDAPRGPRALEHVRLQLERLREQRGAFPIERTALDAFLSSASETAEGDGRAFDRLFQGAQSPSAQKRPR